MAASDYEIVEGWRACYFAKRATTKSGKMSTDRREITDNEIIGMFIHYLRRYCDENDTDIVVITGENGEKIFEAKLLKKEDKQ